MDIKFSIIMPCYNSEAYVENAIKSVINQTYANLEFVIVDDGSIDNTKRIIYEYIKKDKRIKYYYKENGGYSKTINCGLDKVTGDYVLMLGSDDTLDKELLKIINEKIRDILPDYIGFRAEKIKNNKSIGIDDISNFDSFVYENNTNIINFEKKYPVHSKILFTRDTAKCFKRKLIDNLRYFGKYGYDADGIFSTLYSRKCSSFMCIPFNGYYWTIRDDSVSAKTDITKDIDRLNNWKKYLEIINKNKYETTKQENNFLDVIYVLTKQISMNISIFDFTAINTIGRTMKNHYSVTIRNNVFNKSKQLIVKVIAITPFIWVICNKIKKTIPNKQNII